MGDNDQVQPDEDGTLEARQAAEQADFQPQSLELNVEESDAPSDTEVVQQDAETTTKPIANTSTDFSNQDINPEDVGTVEDIDPSLSTLPSESDRA
jgi:hypothetical protein